MTSDIELLMLVRVLCFDFVVTHVGDNMLKDVSVKLMFRSVCKPLNMSEDLQSVFVTTRRGEERRRHPFIDACRSPHACFTCMCTRRRLSVSGEVQSGAAVGRQRLGEGLAREDLIGIGRLQAMLPDEPCTESESEIRLYDFHVLWTRLRETKPAGLCSGIASVTFA